MESRPKKKNLGRTVIQRLVSSEKIIWGYQGKIFKELFSRYPDENFWINVNFSLNITSLEYFNTPTGKKILDKKYFEYYYIPEEVEKDEKENTVKFGEDFKNKNKKNTIRNFLNG
jgi:hypothetical protein